MYVDLFAGAGGLGLGFLWAGWTPLIATDVNARFLETYAFNVHPNTIAGDIRDEAVFSRVIEEARRESRIGDRRVWVLGGPPCQGFSTAGNRRSEDDPRNRLVLDYMRFIEELQPDGFLFENVPGIMNMNRGRVYADVHRLLSALRPQTETWVLEADQFGIPQRRKRVVIIGHDGQNKLSSPPVRTSPNVGSQGLFDPTCSVPTVLDALGDLPPLVPGQDGSALDYRDVPRTDYQLFVRGHLTPREYLDRLLPSG
jgi:DNA (cytosine-5)-methyltransferase 1